MVTEQKMQNPIRFWGRQQTRFQVEPSSLDGRSEIWWRRQTQEHFYFQTN